MGGDRLVPLRPDARSDDPRLGGARVLRADRAPDAAGGRPRRPRRPAAGGLLYLLGAPVTFSVCLVLALIAAFVMLAIRTRVVASKADGTSALSRAMAGLRYLLTQPIVFGAITLDLFAVLVGGVNALLPVFARDILQVGPAGPGGLRPPLPPRAGAPRPRPSPLPTE